MDENLEFVKKTTSYLSDDKLVEAFLYLKDKVKNDGKDSFLTSIEEIEKRLSAFLSGVGNLDSLENESDETCQILEIDLYNLACDMEMSHKISNDSVFHALNETKASSYLGNYAEKISDILSSEAMLHLRVGLTPQQLAQEERELQLQLNTFRSSIFSRIIVFGQWTEQENERMEQMLFSPALDSVSAQLFLSAITLACLNFFDCKKYQLLKKAYSEFTVESIKVRALFGFVLCYMRMPEFLMKNNRHEMLDMATDESIDVFLTDIERLQKWLSISFLSGKKSREIVGHLFGGLMLSTVKDMVGETEEEKTSRIIGSSSDDEDSSFSHHVMDSLKYAIGSELEGYDLYLDQFSVFKNLPFFKKAYNWFLPFYEQHPSVQQLIDKKKNASSFLRVLGSYTGACDADAYGMVAISETNPTLMDEIVSDLSQENELDTKSEDLENDIGKDNRLRTYIRCVSRFFKHSPLSKSFVNPFEDLGHNGYPIYCFLSDKVFQNTMFKGILEKALEFACSEGDSNMMQSLLADGSNLVSQEVRHYLLGVGLAMAKDTDHTKQAIEHFKCALDINPQNGMALWKLFQCAYRVKDYQQVAELGLRLLSTLEKMDTVEIDDNLISQLEDDKQTIKVRVLEAYTELGKTEDAISMAYRLDYENPGDDRVLALLAFLLLHRKSESEKEQLVKAEKIIDECIGEDDDTSFVGLMNEAKQSDKMTKDLLNRLLEGFAKPPVRKPEVDCRLYYCKALCLLSRQEFEEGYKMLYKGLFSLWDCHQEDNMMFRLLREDAPEWLSHYGYSQQKINMLFERLLYNVNKNSKK